MSEQDNRVILAVARGAEAQGTLERISEARRQWELDANAEADRHESSTRAINGRFASSVAAILASHEHRLELLDASEDEDAKELEPF